MNTTVLENKIEALTQVMKSLADDSRWLRELVEKKLAEEQAKSEIRKKEEMPVLSSYSIASSSNNRTQSLN